MPAARRAPAGLEIGGLSTAIRWRPLIRGGEQAYERRLGVTSLAFEPIIIVVDGDAAVRASLKFALELDGFAVEAHESADAVVKRNDLPRRGCLVLDYHLRGMNGLQLLRALRDRHVDMPAVLITTQPSRAVRAEAAAAGVQIVEKPLLSNTLLTSLQRALATGGSGMGAIS